METLTTTQQDSMLEQGPLAEESWLSAGLDFYKLTMSQFMYETMPDKRVTFTLINRGAERLADHVNPDELKQRLDFIRERGWSPNEINYFRAIQDGYGRPRFTEDFLDYLQASALPEVNVRLDAESNDLAVDVTGEAPLVTFWETIVMSEVSEQYFANYVRQNGIDINDLYAEGDRRMNEKLAYLRDHEDVRHVEFGTRRRFSLRWQKHVTERFQNEAPANLVGTSNIALSASEGLKPVGTFAHELVMIYAALAHANGWSIRAAQNRMFEDWSRRYPDLTSMLADTFGSDFTFSQTAPEQAERWSGFRQDSGDPLAFGEKVIRLYRRFGIDAASKTVMFTDSLHMNDGDNTVEPIRKRFKGRLGFLFGIGTNSSNDLGPRPLNEVMKVTYVFDTQTGRGAHTVKRSDDAGKELGRTEDVRLYETECAVSKEDMQLLEGVTV